MNICLKVFGIKIVSNKEKNMTISNNYSPYADIPMNRKPQSGFFDFPKQNVCNDLEHNPPMYLCIPQGQGYRHVCPSCGKVSTLMSPQIIC